MGRPRGDTRERLVRGAFETLRSRGYGGSTSRAIGETAGVNPALVYYYFEDVDDLLVAALAETNTARLDRYRESVTTAASPTELVDTLAVIYRGDVESGFITVVSELVAAGVTRPELAVRVAALMDPWLELAETGVASALAGTPLEAVVPAGAVARAAIVFYLGANLLTHLRPDEAGIDRLLASAAEAASLLEGLGLTRPVDS